MKRITTKSHESHNLNMSILKELKALHTGIKHNQASDDLILHDLEGVIKKMKESLEKSEDVTKGLNEIRNTL